MSPNSILLRFLIPTRADERCCRIGELVFFAVGAALASSWILAQVGLVGLAVVVAALTGLAATCITAHRFVRLRAVAAVLFLGVHLIWFAMAVVFAVVLAWSVPTWVWVLDGVLAATFLAGTFSPGVRVRIPIVVPLGIAIAALVGGWMREDGVIRCDDYLRVRSSGISVLVPSTPDLERCVPGDSLMIDRYPRQFWEGPGGNRFVVTTQRGDHDYSPTFRAGRPAAAWFDGAVCQIHPGAGDVPHCLGQGKGDAIAESPLRDRLYVTAHDATQTTVYALPRADAPLQPLVKIQLPVKASVLYCDDERDVIGLCTEDGGLRLYRLRASDLASLGSVFAGFTSDQMRYDQRLHQGIACGAGRPPNGINGQAFAAVAFNGDPFTYRPLAPSSQYPSSWLAVTWGCDWDPVGRRAYVGIASQGLVAEIDYDTGRILRRSFVGFGLRSLTYDGKRRRIYGAFFLGGDIVAINADTGAVVDRWFAGRFVHNTALSRDQNSLLVTSSLGILRIPLGVSGAQTPDVERP